MKLLKTAIAATALGLSLGFFSTTANAVCLGMACMYNKMSAAEGIDATVGQVSKALEAIKLRNSGGAGGTDKDSDEVIINDIKDALRLSKEINSNDKLDRNRNRANDYLKKARKAIKDGNLAQATEELKEAKNRFSDLKTMIDLTQTDRESQQTHMLNR